MFGYATALRSLTKGRASYSMEPLNFEKVPENILAAILDKNSTAPRAGQAKEMNNQRIRIRLKGYDHRLLDQSAHDIVETAKRTGAKVAGPIPLPTDIWRHTVNRSPHADKKSMEHLRCGRTSGCWTLSTRRRKRWMS